VDLEQYFESYLYSENVVNKKCHDCDVWMLCLGGCRAENYYKNEKIDTPRKNCKEKSEEIEGYLFSV
jgi:radical SAM protein with 4Fe4S-binding SPASM domain